MRLLNNSEIQSVTEQKQLMEIEIGERIVEYIRDNHIAPLRVLMWHLMTELISNVDVLTFNRVMSQEPGNRALEIWNNHGLPPDYYGLVILRRHRTHFLNVFDCSDLIRLFGEFAEALKKTHAYWRNHDREKSLKRPFPTFLDPDKARKVTEGKDKGKPSPHYGWGKTGDGADYFGHRNRRATAGPGIPGLERWRFKEQSVIGAMDRTFGLKERGSDISGTTADSIYVLDYLGENEINPGLLSVLQMLPLATMGAKRHHSILECAYVLSRWKYMDYHIGYYKTLVPTPLARDPEGHHDPHAHVRAGLERVLLPFETDPRNRLLFVWGRGNQKCGLEFNRPVEKTRYRKMSRALTAYGFCVTGGFANWTGAARVMYAINKDLYHDAARYLDNMISRDFLKHFEKIQVLGKWNPVPDAHHAGHYLYPTTVM